MPEIGEIARIVHYLRKHVVKRRITSILTTPDDIVYGKVGCSNTAFEKALLGKTILDARQQGKYFWLVMDSPPHPLMHFGMTGWIKFSNDEAAPYRPGNGKEKKEDLEWPPKYMKFVLKMADEGRGECEVAFVDPRRLARIRLVNVEAGELRNMTPLKENGPDPVIDGHILTREWLGEMLRRKKVPVKALLLDQANISGVGNWVADEILYQAKIHPEQYSNSFSKAQVKDLHDSLIKVCTIACETLADSTQFPENWLMKHRWNKGKKDSNTLPNGAKIIHLKVGGRTSAVVPSVQKKTGPVAGDVDENSGEEEDEEEEKPKLIANSRKSKAVPKQDDDKKGERSKTVEANSRKRKAAVRDEDDDDEEDEDEKLKPKPKPANGGKKKAAVTTESDEFEEEEAEVEEEVDENPKIKAAQKKMTLASNGNSAKKGDGVKPAKKAKTVKEVGGEESGRRRSGRGAGS